MKHVNANEILPEELLTMLQKYYQGGYLYVPKKNHCEVRQPTDYMMELEKRNQHIYLKHLEGRTNRQIGNIYHLSESSVRRIISKERENYQNMKKIIEEILPLWGMENVQLRQVYPSTWEINDSYVIKVYDNKKPLERNIKISTILLSCDIPVAETVLTKTDEKYVEHQELYFLMSRKLQGSNFSDMQDTRIMKKMGCAMAQLHRAFIKCEQEIDFWDNSLLDEMKGWVRDNLANNEWQLVKEAEYSKTVEQLEKYYDDLPKQLIHRDVHFGNFLFFHGNLSGFIDFDLSQRNIRIFDICYFLTGLLAEETDNPLTKTEWLENVKAVVAGYESINKLSTMEKHAIPCVMKCIEILFVAYFIGINDTKCAKDAYRVFHFIGGCEGEIRDGG